MPPSRTRAARRRAAAPEPQTPWWRAIEPARLAGPTAIAVVGAAMLAWTWRTWPDPFIDYGREVYLAWQVADGRTLYRDVVHFNGPFSVLLNALVLWLAGPGILHLALANGVLALGVLALAYHLLVRTADRTAATVGGLAFVLVFAFGRFVRLGNYNWLSPYSHELTHGVGLAVATLWCLDRFQVTRRTGWLVATGAGLGLVALTKTEVLVAGAAATLVGVLLTLRHEPAKLRAAGAVLGGALIPLAAAFLWFVGPLGVADAFAWPLGYWRAAARPEVTSMPLYREGMGVDDVAGNLGRLAAAAGGIAVALVLAAVAAWGCRGRGPDPRRDLGLGLVAAALAWFLVPGTAWFSAARTLPLATALVALTSTWSWLRTTDRDAADRLALRTALAVLGLALLAKIVLYVRVFHYGFALAVPATLVALAALVCWLPAAVARRGWSGDAFRAVMLGLVVVGVAAHLTVVRGRVAAQTQPLGSGADTLYGDDRVPPLRALASEIRTRVRSDQTLTIFPEGVLLSYLTRRRSALPYPQYTPLTVLLWGEARMRADLEATAPDFVALIHRENAHEGARFFGTDYAVSLLDFVKAGYRPVWRIGAEPLRDDRFGIVLYERVAPSAPASGSP